MGFWYGLFRVFIGLGFSTNSSCGEAEEYSSIRVSRDERENFARAVEGMRVTRDVCFFLSFSIRVRNIRFLIK